MAYGSPFTTGLRSDMGRGRSARGVPSPPTTDEPVAPTQTDAGRSRCPAAAAATTGDGAAPRGRSATAILPRTDGGQAGAIPPRLPGGAAFSSTPLPVYSAHPASASAAPSRPPPRPARPAGAATPPWVSSRTDCGRSRRPLVGVMACPPAEWPAMAGGRCVGVTVSDERWDTPRNAVGGPVGVAANDVPWECVRVTDEQSAGETAIDARWDGVPVPLPRATGVPAPVARGGGVLATATRMGVLATDARWEGVAAPPTPTGKGERRPRTDIGRATGVRPPPPFPPPALATDPAPTARGNRTDDGRQRGVVTSPDSGGWTGSSLSPPRPSRTGVTADAARRPPVHGWEPGDADSRNDEGQ